MESAKLLVELPKLLLQSFEFFYGRLTGTRTQTMVIAHNSYHLNYKPQVNPQVQHRRIESSAWTSGIVFTSCCF